MQLTPIQYLVDKVYWKHGEYAPELPVLSCLLNCELSRNSIEKIFSATTSQGDTLVHLATERNRFNTVKILVEQGLCNPTISNDKNESPLHIACNSCQRCEIALFLCECGCSVHQLNKSGHSPLFIAFKSNVSLLQQLIQKGYWKLEDPVLELHDESYRGVIILSKFVDTPFKLPLPHSMLLHSRYMYNQKIIVDLVTKYDLPNLCDSFGNTLLHLCSALEFNPFEGESLPKALLALKSCKVNEKNEEGNTPLHIACAVRNKAMIELMVGSEKCAESISTHNTEGRTPVYYASDRNSINLLVMNGANPEEVAKSSMVQDIVEMFGTLKEKHPIDPTVTALVLGDSQAGKTTLINSLKVACKWRQSTEHPNPVGDATKRTAGVEISEYRVFQTDIPRILFYDFAGQKKYDIAHSVLLQNFLFSSQSSEPSPILFIIVLNVNATDKLSQLIYWIKFIEKCLANMSTEPEIVLICSHDDEFPKNANKQDTSDLLVDTITETSTSVKLIENPIYLDCREKKGNQLQRMEGLLMRSTDNLKKRADVDIRCHVLFAYLYEHFPNDPVKLSTLQNSLKVNQLTAFQGNGLPFTQGYTVELLKSMHHRQHILLFGQLQSDFWILTAKAQKVMFNEVSGKLFANERFESNVGVISSMELKQAFPEVEYEILQQFLVYSEFCYKIEDFETMKLIEGDVNYSAEHAECADQSDKKPDYFFFPSLVKAKKPQDIWTSHESDSHVSGWCLEISFKDHLFGRFLQALILRAVFSFATTDLTKKQLQRRCVVWKNGVFWGTPEGVEVLVEVVEQTTVVVLLCCSKDQEMDAIKLQSSVVKMVCKAHTDYCPGFKVTEYVIVPDSPSKFNKSQLTLENVEKISIAELAHAICSGSPCVQDASSRPIHINKKLLHFEPYAGIGKKHNLISSLFDPDKANEEVPEDILRDYALVSYQASAKPSQVAHMMNIPSTEIALYRNSEPESISMQLFSIFNYEIRTYKHIRECFDRYSVFHGRNPMDMVPKICLLYTSDAADE